MKTVKVIVIGGTGFVGRALVDTLLCEGSEVVVLTRQTDFPPAREGLRFVPWDLARVGGSWESEFEGADAVINLAGEPIAGKRWTPAQKQELLESRIRSVQAVHKAVSDAASPPAVVINASAVGFYGARGDECLDELSPAGEGFLPDLCRRWEECVQRIEGLGVRTVRLRIGIVLETGGGALGKMLFPFRLGLGGPLGSGRQWMSWIHRSDLIGLILFLLENETIRGVVNATAPNPVTMAEFSGTLGSVLGRPAFFPVPGFVLHLLLGEMADMLLTGQRVQPRVAEAKGFSFRFPELRAALESILK